jgi:cyanophycinase
MSAKPKGSLIIIGGHEDKSGDKVILSEVARRAKQGRGRLLITAVASQLPDEMEAEYRKVFGELGVRSLNFLGVRERGEAFEDKVVQRVVDASLIFFTGGDQLRITSQIGDSPVYRCMRDLYWGGGTVVGTSAGAAAMSETMLISGESDGSHDIGALGMAPGLGLLSDVVIDSHFAERGRMGRLIGAVAQNPKNIGLGIDEDTAIIVDGGERFRVLGSGAVYVVDGTRLTYSSLSDKQPEGILSVNDLTLHVLGAGDEYDLVARRPAPAREAQAA